MMASLAEPRRHRTGTRLSSVLRDRYGVAPDGTVAVRLHLFEAIQGTTLSHIALHEKGLAGLGSSRRSSWTLLHPLTPCGAGLLFQEPGLGSDVADRFLSDRNLISVGQRFFFMEVPGVTPRPLPSIGTGRSATVCKDGASRTSLILDFLRGQLRLFVYYSDADAQNLKKLLQKRSPGAIPALFTAGLDTSLRMILKGDAPKQLRVLHEAVPTQDLAAGALGRVLAIAWEQIEAWIIEWALKALKAEVERGYANLVARFAKAADDPACGVTLVLVYQGPTFLQKLGSILRNPVAGLPGIGALFGSGQAATVTVELKPGMHYA